jgi:hypothetical protein
MDAPEDRSKALNEHMSSGFAPRADIVAACRHVRFVPEVDMALPMTSFGCARFCGLASTDYGFVGRPLTGDGARNVD